MFSGTRQPPPSDDNELQCYIGGLADRVLSQEQTGTVPKYLRSSDSELDEVSARLVAKSFFEKLTNAARLRAVLEVGK